MKSWLSLGGYRIGQPAELAKLATILMLARVLAARRESPRALLELWQPLLVVAVPWLLVLAQKDVGTAIVFIGICFAMLFWAGVSWPVLLMLASPGISLLLAFSTGAWGAWFLLLGALMLWYRPYLLEGATLMLANVTMGIVAPILWERLAPYQQRRLLVFLDPSYDPRNAGWNVVQSKVAIGSGGIFGNGFTLGSQKRLQFLPERHTDFIKLAEFFRRYIAVERDVIVGRPQILAEREDVNVNFAKILHDFDDFFERLTHSENHPGFCRNVRSDLFCKAKDFQHAEVAAARTCLLV